MLPDEMLAREWLHEHFIFLDDTDIQSLAALLSQVQAKVRLETLKSLHSHDCEVFTKREALACGCLARAIAALEQAAGGSAAAKES